MKSFFENLRGANTPVQLSEEKEQLSRPVAGRKAAIAAAALLTLVAACKDYPGVHNENDTSDFSEDHTNTSAPHSSDSDPSGIPSSEDSESTESHDIDLPPCGAQFRGEFLAAMATAEAYANKIYTVQPGEHNRFFDLPMQLQGWTRLDDSSHSSTNSQGNQTITIQTTYERIANSGQRSLLQAYHQTGDGLNMAPVVVRANFSGVPDNSLPTGNLVAFQVTTNAIQSDPMAANHQYRVEYYEQTPLYCDIKYNDDTVESVCLEDCLENLSGVTSSVLDQQSDHPDSRFFE